MPTKKKGSDTDKATSSESAKPQSSANSQPGGKENMKAKSVKEEKAKDKSAGASASAKSESKKKDNKNQSGQVSAKPKAKAKDDKADDSSIAATTTDVIQFLKEVDIERRKISWPEPSQVVRETWSVLFLVTIITTLVLSFDWAVGHFVFGPLEHWARLNGGGIGRP